MAEKVSTDRSLHSEVRSTFWYHTIDLGDGVVTPGFFDLRPVIDILPWPEVKGKRCLDVGTYDGFLAFEMEKRGAKEVVALDISSQDDWDWPTDVRVGAGGRFETMVGRDKAKGFNIAARALGSSVKRQELNIYDLSPERVGSFDLVVCGSLLLHLRDPLMALEAIRSVCTGSFMSSEQINLGLTVMLPRIAVAGLNGLGDDCQWWVPNRAGHARMVAAGGFTISDRSKPFSIPFGAGFHPGPSNLKQAWLKTFRTALTGNNGVPHSAVLARPVPGPRLPRDGSIDR